MMDVNVSIDDATIRKMERVIDSFVKNTGKTAEDGIRRIAVAGAKQLATKVQPYGISSKTKDMLHGIVAKQSHRAISNANVEGIEGSAASVHLHGRVAGRVPRGIATWGQFKRSPISFPERNAHVEKQVQKVGRAKSAWIEAGENIEGGGKISVQAWLRKNIGGGYGTSKSTDQGMNHVIILSNTTPYLRKIQSTQDVASAVATAMKNSFKAMITATRKEIEKANRAL